MTDVSGRVDRNDAGLEPLHIMLVIPTRRPDIPPVEILLRAQVRLGQRRATERDPRLSADEHDAALEALFAERHRGVATGEPAADDHDRPIAASCLQRWHCKHCTHPPRHATACAGSRTKYGSSPARAGPTPPLLPETWTWHFLLSRVPRWWRARGRASPVGRRPRPRRTSGAARRRGRTAPARGAATRRCAGPG